MTRTAVYASVRDRMLQRLALSDFFVLELNRLSATTVTGAT